AARVSYLDGVVEDREPRRDSCKREVAMRERVGKRFGDSAALVVRTRLDGRLLRAPALKRARALLPEVAVALDEAQRRLKQRVQVAREFDRLDLRRLRARAREPRGRYRCARHQLRDALVATEEQEAGDRGRDAVASCPAGG